MTGLPDNFSSQAYRDAFERTASPRRQDNERIASAALAIIQKASIDLGNLEEAPGPKTAELIDEAIAWLDEHLPALKKFAERDAQDL